MSAAEEANRLLSKMGRGGIAEVRDYSNPDGTTPTDDDLVSRAMVLSMLAVADELRTANLMQLLTLQNNNHEVLEYGEREPLVLNIRTRLGLDS